MVLRHIDFILDGQATSDGAGVNLTRIIGPDRAARLDPFLLLDEFGSDSSADYIAGFPAHPHRGFETVSYMLHGEMEHQDHLGNVGRLRSGDVQWMTAARGIIHSEMPKQEAGLMQGFQLWINLPAAQKMNDPAYRDIPAADIPVYPLSTGAWLKVIAGQLQIGKQLMTGAVAGISTDPLYVDLHLPAGESLTVPMTAGHTAMCYVFQGRVRVNASTAVNQSQLAVLSDGDAVQLHALSDTRVLLLAAKPIGEPVVHYGPFVMNSRDEINQALMDYQNGRLTE